MNHEFWMIVSAVTGFSCFVIIHFTKLLKNPKSAAVLQLAANTFVFVSWGASFLAADSGLFKLFCFGGTVVPTIMASLTIRRVFIKKKTKETRCGADR